MSAAVAMRERLPEASPRKKARAAGVFYLLTIVTGGFAFSASGRFIVSGNAAATSSNILGSEPLFRLGIASDILATACYVAVTALFYELFTPVDRSVSRLAAFLSLVGCAAGAVGGLLHGAPLVVLGGGPLSRAFTAEQAQAVAYMFLSLNARAFNIGLVFFGFYCLLIGSLIWRSTFLPRILGVLMALAGLGWLTGSFADVLSPPLARSLSAYTVVAGGLGEGSLCLWLLVAGVDAQRWREQEGRA